MQFSITAGQLAKPLQLAQGSVETKTSIPILSNLLIQEYDHGISITGSNLETKLRTYAPADVQELSPMTVNASKVVALIKQLPAEAIVTITEKDGKATIKAGRSRFSLATIPADQYPAFQEHNGQSSITMASDALSWLIDSTLHAVGNNDVRYYLNGMFFSVNNGVMKAVASDGHRLSMACLEVEAYDIPGFILPRNTVLRLAKMSIGDVTISVSPNTVQFDFDGFRYSSKLIDGRYPDVERVMLKDNNVGTRIILNRAEFAEAINRVKVLGEKERSAVILKPKEGEVHISLTNSGNENADDMVSAETDIGIESIGFNADYLLDAVSHLSSESVELAISTSGNSGRLKDPESDRIVHVVMPMRV